MGTPPCPTPFRRQFCLLFCFGTVALAQQALIERSKREPTRLLQSLPENQSASSRRRLPFKKHTRCTSGMISDIAPCPCWGPKSVKKVKNAPAIAGMRLCPECKKNRLCGSGCQDKINPVSNCEGIYCNAKFCATCRKKFIARRSTSATRAKVATKNAGERRRSRPPPPPRTRAQSTYGQTRPNKPPSALLVSESSDPSGDSNDEHGVITCLTTTQGCQGPDQPPQVVNGIKVKCPVCDPIRARRPTPATDKYLDSTKAETFALRTGGPEATLQSEIDAMEQQLQPGSSNSRIVRRRVLERLLHYENYYSSGAEGHPRYYN